MSIYSSEYIKEIVSTIEVTPDEIFGNELVIQAFLLGLNRVFMDKKTDLSDSEIFVQFLVYLSYCPIILQEKIYDEMPELTDFSPEIAIKSHPPLDDFSS